MEHTENTPGPGPKASAHHGEIDLDSLDFRPLSNGLGFNDRKNAFPTPQAQPTSALGSNSNRSSNFNNRASFVPPRSKEQIVQDYVQSNLQRPTINRSSSERPPQLQRSLATASLFKVVGAWLCDFVILSSVFAIAIQLLMLMALDQSSLNFFLMMDVKLKLLFAIMYLLCYWAYFSIFHLKMTPGGILTGVVLVPKKSKRLSLSQTSMRAGLVIISILALGLPFIWNFPSKVSETELVQQ